MLSGFAFACGSSGTTINNNKTVNKTTINKNKTINKTKTVNKYKTVNKTTTIINQYPTKTVVCQGKDGRDGRDGIDGKDGKDFYGDFYGAYQMKATAGAVAVDNIDFNPDRQGFSVGVGYGVSSSSWDTEQAGAVGLQYGFGNSISTTVKGWATSTDEYAVGAGLVIGF
jgi:hypothetical protein